MLFLLPRPKGADEARIIGHQDSIQNTFELRSIYTAIGSRPVGVPLCKARYLILGSYWKCDAGSNTPLKTAISQNGW
jgi:hypothetical protein